MRHMLNELPVYEYYGGNRVMIKGIRALLTDELKGENIKLFFGTGAQCGNPRMGKLVLTYERHIIPNVWLVNYMDVPVGSFLARLLLC